MFDKKAAINASTSKSGHKVKRINDTSVPAEERFNSSAVRFVSRNLKRNHNQSQELKLLCVKRQQGGFVVKHIILPLYMDIQRRLLSPSCDRSAVQTERGSVSPQDH